MTLARCRKFLGALLFAAFGTGAQAQGFPNHPITFIYPYPPGSNSDTAWRIITQELSRRLNVPVVFENRAGGGGRVGMEAIMKAPPDGYLFGMTNNVMIVWQPLMEAKFDIQPGRDYTPIAHGIETPLVLAASGNAPFRDLKGLIAYARANPGKLNAASSGPGSGAHLGIALLNYKAGINITHVPYKGAAPALTGLVAGEADLLFTDAGAKPYLDSGRMIGIAVGSEQRWALMPKVPTLSEAGVPGFRNTSWTSVSGPPHLPADVVSRLNRALNESMNTGDVKQKLEDAGWAIKGGTPEEFTAIIKADTELYRPVIRAANIRMDQ